MPIPKINLILLVAFMFSCITKAQFVDDFNNKKIEGWDYFTGDGNAEIDFIQRDGYASIFIDATKDNYNVYWTLIKRDVTSFLDLSKLKDISFQLRVEARVRVHNAPRRLNFMVNTNRTTDFHKDLMEYDIADTTDWHIISMTTKRFDALPGDTVYVQLCATDYGLGKYYVDIDYYRADIVNVNEAGPDKGVLVPYHPPIPGVSTFSNHVAVKHDALINSEFPDVNFNNWQAKGKEGTVKILTINSNQWIILKWDFEKFKNMKVKGAGLLELSTYSIPKGGEYIEAYGEDFGIEFGKVRVIEILSGDHEWEQNKVTYNNLILGQRYNEVFNEQMTFDAEINEEPGSLNYITISNPVMQRLIEGKTKGLLIKPLGAVDASFYSLEDQSGINCPKLHFNIQ